MIPAFATVSATIKQGKNRDTLLTIENNLGLSCLSQDCSSAYGADLPQRLSAEAATRVSKILYELGHITASTAESSRHEASGFSLLKAD